jgi:uncharacterized protein
LADLLIVFNVPPGALASVKTYNLTTFAPPFRLVYLSLPMKLHPDSSDGPSVSAIGSDWLRLDGQRIDRSVVFSSKGAWRAWSCARFDDLSASDFESLIEEGCELVLFGSGQRLRFPRAEWIAPLIRRRIGIETMDMGAACRTYNVLAAEGRHVVAAILLEPPRTDNVSR